MMATLVIVGIFAALFIWALRKTLHSMKNNTCPGCSASCSVEEKKACPSTSRVMLEINPKKE